ncbi:MAG: hypothetical protein Q4P28_04455 [Tissierellia bacterium]|nr:hypothetical protein [Tissierellia bacterium]
MEKNNKKKDQKNSKVELFVNYEKVGLDGLKMNTVIQQGDSKWNIETNINKKEGF